MEPNHLSAILCSCVKLEDGSWKEYLENCDGEAFDVRAAHSFCQWQCVLRDAIHLNCVLEEPIETPCIRKIFNGQLVHHLNRELARGCKLESLIPNSLSRYQDLYTAIIANQEEKEEIGAEMQKLQLRASRN